MTNILKEARPIETLELIECYYRSFVFINYQSAKHNALTQYRIAEHCRGSISALRAPPFIASVLWCTGRDVTRPTLRWLAGIIPTGLRLTTDSKRVNNRQISRRRSHVVVSPSHVFKTQLNSTQRPVGLSWVSCVSRHALGFTCNVGKVRRAVIQ